MELEESTSAEKFIGRLAEKLGAAARAATIFADPVERDGITVIPVAKARWGLVAVWAASGMRMEQAVAEAHKSRQ